MGFGEIHQLSHVGRAFTMLLVVGGAGSMLYMLTVMAEEVLEGKLRQIMWRCTLERKIRALKDYYLTAATAVSVRW